MPAEHQRVFFIEERSARRQRVFFIEEKVCQTPEAGGFSFIVEKKPIRTRAPEALASGTFFVPFAHIDRLVRR
jgi:hypothetical protein